MNWPEMSPRRLRATFDRYMSLFNRFERLPLPVITAVQGFASAVDWSWRPAQT